MKSLILILITTLLGATQAFAAPQLSCTPDGESEVQFSAQATVLAEDKVSDLVIKYMDEPHSQSGIVQGKRTREGEMAGMMLFLVNVDGGSLGIAVPKGFSRMTKAFKGYFLLVGGGSGGASPVSCLVR